MRHQALAAAVLLTAFALPVRAGRGPIAPAGTVRIAEPTQTALLAWDGETEVLLLQTRVRANRPMTLVQFLPLPARPQIDRGHKAAVSRLQALATKLGLRYEAPAATTGSPEARDVRFAAAGEVPVLSVTVVEIMSPEAFAQWARDFFKEQDLGQPALGDALRAHVADCLNRGLRFFAVDTIHVGPRAQAVEPVAYTFRSDRLFYPLKLSNLGGGRGVVDLVTILPMGLDLVGEPFRDLANAPNQPNSGRERGEVLRSAAKPFPRELAADVQPAIPSLLGCGFGVMRAWRYTGPLMFSRDVALEGRFEHHALVAAFLEALTTADLARLQAMTAAPFDFDGKKVLPDRAALDAALAELAADCRGETFTLNPARIRYLHPDELTRPVDQAFFRDHLKPRHGAALMVLIGDKRLGLFLARPDGPAGEVKVMGFSD